MSPLGELLTSKRVVICCGAGGVGKTTTAAALAVAEAVRGRRVLVLTIDPSRRLAEALGVDRNTPEPVAVDLAGLEARGSLQAWMLDPRQVSDATMRRLVKDPAEAERLMAHPIYDQVTQMVAGMQEYTAMEALHGFVERGVHDLVILDTPPARNALNFLEAPGRLGEFLEGRVFQMLLPQPGGLLAGATRRVAATVLSGVLGEDFHAELQTFFGAFAGIFARLNGNAQAMRRRLQAADVTFLLVTTPGRSAVEDAGWFARRVRELELPLGGFVLNRSRAAGPERAWPEPSLVPAAPSDEDRVAFARLLALAAHERDLARSDERLLEALDASTDAHASTAVPELPAGCDDLPALAALGALLVGSAHG